LRLIFCYCILFNSAKFVKKLVPAKIITRNQYYQPSPEIRNHPIKILTITGRYQDFLRRFINIEALRTKLQRFKNTSE